MYCVICVYRVRSWLPDELHRETRRSSKLAKLGVENLIHVLAKGGVSANWLLYSSKGRFEREEQMISKRLTVVQD